MEPLSIVKAFDVVEQTKPGLLVVLEIKSMNQLIFERAPKRFFKQRDQRPEGYQCLPGRDQDESLLHRPACLVRSNQLSQWDADVLA